MKRAIKIILIGVAAILAMLLAFMDEAHAHPPREKKVAQTRSHEWRPQLKMMLVILLAFFSLNPRARAWSLFELQEASIDYKNFAALNPNARDALIYPEHPKEGVAVNLNTDIARYLYWNNTVHSTTTGSQYRAVGLETRLGLYLTPSWEVGLYHHSQHLLDRSHTYMERYPSEDAIQVKFYLYRTKEGKGLIP